MIEREIAPRLTSLFQQYPIVTITGPRQSGKTTLCRATFPHLLYLNLESPAVREAAESDPQGFLAQCTSGAIIDEVQNVPELLSYIQVDVDERRGNSLYVLTGSEQFRLSRVVSQSLAGRTALLTLLPFSLAEQAQAGTSTTIDDVILSGFLPRIHDQKLNPQQALDDYFATYIQRDVRQSNEIRNMSSFKRFVQLCAGRVGQLVNLSSLGADTSVSHKTAREWLSILEASYVIFQLPPYFGNIRKRLIKSPKLYFYDVGLASYLIGIDDVRQVATHPLRGPLFENIAVIEMLKNRFNRGHRPQLSFFRDSSGLECDLLCETGYGFHTFEIKAGVTMTSESFKSLDKVSKLLPNVVSKTVVYGGATKQKRSNCTAIPLSSFGASLDRLDADQALSTFVDEKQSPPPALKDVDNLDAAYRYQIRPTLDALESRLSRLGNSLFQSFRQGTSVSKGTLTVNGSNLLLPAHWEKTKNEYVLSAGFVLSDDQPLEIRAEFGFNNYTGLGKTKFSMSLTIKWVFRSSCVRCHVTLDSTPISTLDITIEYSYLQTAPSNTDRVVTEVITALLAQITDQTKT
ncbi:MAG: ATP-binding protein [Acidimicrobiia bacterium]|nr:ATP-binding protein [Acidimicrobiia bacterium]MYC58096.1 ATP-binding protein [Acidimicrobiia bacterium]MYI30731.1 ATP-binding protein [Acidimicrobiia bacterium]